MTTVKPGRPVLVDGPSSAAVTLAEIKAHLRMEPGDDAHDFELVRRLQAAESYLDGHGGRLGRCIMPQTWAVKIEAAGECVLPMPDVVEARLDGESGSTVLEVGASEAGPVVVVAEPGTVTFRCAMPLRLREMAKSAICFLVERDFDRPSGQHYDALTRSIGATVSALRWRQV